VTARPERRSGGMIKRRYLEENWGGSNSDVIDVLPGIYVRELNKCTLNIGKSIRYVDGDSTRYTSMVQFEAVKVTLVA
jgi:hypothetical protein